MKSYNCAVCADQREIHDAYGSRMTCPLCVQLTSREACTPADRIRIIRHVYDAVIHETTTFRGAVGCDLAYLLAAIGGAHTYCTFHKRSGIVRILRKHFASTEPVWLFIEIENPHGPKVAT